MENQNRLDQSLFNPKHIAFIGASEKSTLGSMLYLVAFKESQWASTFYPVNPKYEKIMDWKCYSSVLDIPFPVDTAYISVKTKIIPSVLIECVEKKISWVIIFSSGFSETGDKEGFKLENHIKEIIKDSNTRVIGPNCLGPFNGENGMAFSFTPNKGISGGISFMSQSGGHLTQLLDVGAKRDFRYRYGVSFGNQVNLNAIDFLRFYHNDIKTKLIAAYLESFGSGYGNDFYLELKATTKSKPVIIWKGGYTNDGSRAAFSHTGAMASEIKLWNVLAKQAGAVIVRNNIEFWNVIKTFELLVPQFLPKGRKVGIITPGGGSSVNATDLLAVNGLKVPELTLESQKKISEILPKENVNVKNPVDLGAVGFVLDIFIRCIEVVAKDPIVDILLIPLWPHFLYSHVFTKMIKTLKKSGKPFAFSLPSISDSLDVAKKFSNVQKILHKQRVLYFFNLSEAARSLSLLCDYSEYLQSH
ncbi:MAG: CoA-binding protein [Candidatus Lokiarchaeota archaeon]|nr:CoA-binding protein [Candidatus Lokiarchaeota archaeon]